ncbi:MAG: nuclear transport factor 2 family protein [Gammaproteobacteria bacterium]
MKDAEKIQWLFDVESIKQLKHRYCAFCDEQYNPDGIAGLFTEDGVWDGAAFGRAEGREAIRKFFSDVRSQIEFANHYVTNPIIEINGDTATGRWDLWQPMVSAPEPAALWLIAKYREQYVRIDDGWLIQLLELDIKALSPYESGFAKQRFMELG